MKKWLTLSLALVIAAVSQAVTVAWTVPNSNKATTEGVSGWFETEVGSAYFVYSTDPLGSVGGDCANVYTAATSSEAFSFGVVKNEKQTLIGTDVAGPTLAADAAVGTEVTGYYYMVVVNKDADPKYAVAGTQVTFTKTENDGWTANRGVFVNEVGSTPSGYDYFDFDTWLGGTWTSVGAPEPTVLALLALGVAGVALRRKQNFTK